MRAPHAESLVSKSKPSLALSRRPTGATHGVFSAGSGILPVERVFSMVYTVERSLSSDAVVTMPRGLFIMR